MSHDRAPRHRLTLSEAKAEPERRNNSGVSSCARCARLAMEGRAANYCRRGSLFSMTCW